MKKAMTKAGIVLAATVLVSCSGEDLHVERSTTIDAPMDFVQQHLTTFEQINQWSPWMKLDPNMESSIEGADGQVGCKYSWSGNDDVGKGEQTITEIASDKVVTSIHFIEPFDSEATATTTLSEADGKTTVTWAFDQPGSFMSTVIGLFMDMDEMLGTDFQKGMDNLNALVMANKAARKDFGGYTIETVDLGERTYIGKKSTVAMADLGNYFTTNLGKVHSDVAKAKVEMAGMPSGVYFSWDEASGQTEMMAAMPVAAGAVVKGYEPFTISGKALKAEHRGPYEETAKAHSAMEEYIRWHGAKQNGPVIEEYANDPALVPPSEILTVIYYPIAE